MTKTSGVADEKAGWKILYWQIVFALTSLPQTKFGSSETVYILKLH